VQYVRSPVIASEVTEESPVTVAKKLFHPVTVVKEVIQHHIFENSFILVLILKQIPTF
jgi:hypothetical protein